ncbi:MAG: hypothetical protein FJ027_06265 [Candidatus Rokubacteria bacterium]|nr:hypothetical protein [Candidatus Rokubacteria bacterium]
MLVIDADVLRVIGAALLVFGILLAALQVPAIRRFSLRRRRRGQSRSNVRPAA